VFVAEIVSLAAFAAANPKRHRSFRNRLEEEHAIVADASENVKTNPISDGFRVRSNVNSAEELYSQLLARRPRIVAL
jgi:hypothetical protein